VTSKGHRDLMVFADADALSTLDEIRPYADCRRRPGDTAWAFGTGCLAPSRNERERGDRIGCAVRMSASE